MAYLVQAKGLTVGYHNQPVVKDIEFSLAKGQILSLIGPNGAGKSTILKSITGQLKTLGGVISIAGASIAQLQRREIARRMAVVLTQRPRPELMTCGDVVALGRIPYTGMLGILSQSDRKIVDESLDMVNALHLKERNFLEISDGQLQRIMLARAICQEPEVIVLDEPTSHLDVRYAVEILDILRNMAHQRGVAVIMSLHELNYARRVSDLVMCIKDGHVMYLDKPGAIFTETIICRLYNLSRETYRELFGGL